MTITSIDATDETLIATGMVFARAAVFDDYFGHEDDGRTAAWAEAIQKYNLDRADLLNAVTTFYAGTPGGRLSIGELIRLARQSRQDTAMRREHDERAKRGITTGLTPITATTTPDTQLGGLPIAGADGDPVWAAYDINNAINHDCPTCKEPAGGACVNTRNDQARKIPCLARMRL
ncbi:hypothetical protein [Rhodococcus sp. UNC363MFTsu5.1]|uniref:hypothetical protein n=1 Tax=Rhodococcus sp. UNC363MFTsu5.1 TaxID=1449069 RepID=UPI00047FB4BB|nr:hypothetical protein [Rhodococcus sp. UNC363MFTsu5.1]